MKLSETKIAILATDGFEQSELTSPRDYFTGKGATVHVVAPDGKTEIRAWDGDDWGTTVPVDRNLGSVESADYHALVLPGGQINPDKLRIDEQAVGFVRSFAADDRTIAAICHAPWLLIEAGLVKGKRVTSFESIRTDVRNAGAAEVPDEEVVVDANLITSRKPGDLPAFNRAIERALTEAKQPVGA